jgi:hypothetical protein
MALSDFCQYWAGYMGLTSLPQYMEDVLKFDIRTVSVGARRRGLGCGVTGMGEGERERDGRECRSQFVWTKTRVGGEVVVKEVEVGESVWYGVG